MNIASHTNGQQASSDTRLRELDVLRGLAAIAVVYCHFLSQCHVLGRIPFEFRWGSYGPHLFFMISGFVIFMTLSHCKRPMDFVFSRFSRLYPLYWMGVLFSTMIICNTSGTRSSITFSQLLANLTMLQTWLRVPDIEVAYWTLGVELKFYVLMLAILYWRKAALIEYICAGWLLLILGYRWVDAAVSMPRIVATPLILDYAHLFVAGIMFYRIRIEGGAWIRHGLIAMAIPMAYLAEGLEVALFSAGFVGVFYLFVKGKLRWIAFRPLHFLGTISYALYLIHGGLGYALIERLHDYRMPISVLLTVPTAVCLGVSAILTIYFERPVLSRMRAWYKATRTTNAHERLAITPSSANIS